MIDERMLRENMIDDEAREKLIGEKMKIKSTRKDYDQPLHPGLEVCSFTELRRDCPEHENTMYGFGDPPASFDSEMFSASKSVTRSNHPLPLALTP